MLRKTVAIVVILWLALATIALAGEVSLGKARIVAENRLTYYVKTYGGWAGSTSPKIKADELMIFKDQVVGYNFVVSPKGHIIVPYRDELPPVKLYSETTTVSMQDKSELVGEWIREELFKLDKALVEHAVEMGNVDFKATSNGRLWALFESDQLTFTKAYETTTDGATIFPTYFKYKSTINKVYRTNYASDSAWMQVFKTETRKKD